MRSTPDRGPWSVIVAEAEFVAYRMQRDAASIDDLTGVP
jgi:hypothetical protein